MPRKRSQSIRLNHTNVNIEMDTRNDRPFVTFLDPSTGGSVTCYLEGAKLFRSETSQYPLPPELEEVIREQLMNPDHPYIFLSEAEQRKRVRAVLRAFIEFDRVTDDEDLWKFE